MWGDVGATRLELPKSNLYADGCGDFWGLTVTAYW
jgi:hypothetical protein